MLAVTTSKEAGLDLLSQKVAFNMFHNSAICKLQTSLNLHLNQLLCLLLRNQDKVSRLYLKPRSDCQKPFCTRKYEIFLTFSLLTTHTHSSLALSPTHNRTSLSPDPGSRVQKTLTIFNGYSNINLKQVCTIVWGFHYIITLCGSLPIVNYLFFHV